MGGHVYVADMSGAINGEDFAASGSGALIASEFSKVDIIMK